MALTVAEQEEVNRAEALLTGLSDVDKRAVVRMAYVQPQGTLEESIKTKRSKLEANNVRRGQIDALATRTGLVLEPVDSVDNETQALVDKYDKATVQTALDASS